MQVLLPFNLDLVLFNKKKKQKKKQNKKKELLDMLDNSRIKGPRLRCIPLGN